jgi:hypothetical protein
MDPLAELAEYAVISHIDKDKADYQVWSDFKITSIIQEVIRPGLPDIHFEMPCSTSGTESFAYVSEADANYILATLKTIFSTVLLDQMIEKHGLEVKTEGTHNRICVPKDKYNLLPASYIDDLILNKDKELICPGIIIPETTFDEDEFDTAKSIESASVTSIEAALDGLEFRIYYDANIGAWAICGEEEQCHHFFDLEIQQGIDYTLLNKEYCYYVVMEHKNLVNVIPYVESRAILVEVVTCHYPFQEIDLQEIKGGFTHVQIRHKSDRTLSCNALLDLANQYKIGIIVRFASGRRVRIESSSFQYLLSLQPFDITDVYKQWIYKLRRPIRTENVNIDAMLQEAEQDICIYLTHYSCHMEKFNYMRERFQEIYNALCYKLKFQNMTVPIRLVAFYEALSPMEKNPVEILRKLIHSTPDDLFYIMNPYNVTN